MLQVQCAGCMTQVFLECTCPPGHIDAIGIHDAGCSHYNIDANVACDPASSDPRCCHIDHDHGAAANACPANHAGKPCPEPEGQCKTWRGAIADAFHPEFDGNHPLFKGSEPPPCPGGHCAKGVDGCTVCRPLVITVMPGTQITMAGAG